MKYLRYTIFVIAVSLCSCVKSALDLPKEKLLADGMTRIKIQTNFAGFAKPTTRGEGIEGSNIEVFLLDKDWNNVLTESATINTATGIVEVTLAFSGDETDKYRVAIIANPPAKFNNGTTDKEFSKITWGDISDYTTLKEKLNTLPIGVDGVSGTEIPMTGISREYEKKELEELTSPIEIDLTRMVAKVEVISKVSPSEFQLDGISMYNAPTRGWFFSPTDYPAKMRDNTGGLIDYNFSASPLYLYESRKEEKSAVIVAGRYNGSTVSTYYRLEVDKDYTYSYKDINGVGKTMPVKRGDNYFLRNCHYVFNIISVSDKGYASPEEAMAGNANNSVISASVDVIDLSSHDIVDNGEYYLGVSNSRYYYYGTLGLSSANLSIATVSHNAPRGVSNIKIELPTGIELASPSPFADNDGSVQSGELMVNITESFTGGSIKLTVGSITKNVIVEVKDGLNNIPSGICDDFADGLHVVGEIKDASASWVKLSTSSSGSLASGSSYVTTDEGDIYFVFNSVMNMSPRYTEILLSRRDGGGRAKVHFGLKDIPLETPPSNVIEGTTDYANNTFSFTFKNEGGYPFIIEAWEVDKDGNKIGSTPLYKEQETDLRTDVDRTITLPDMPYEVGVQSVQYIMVCTFYNGQWYENTYEFQRVYEGIVRILTVGRTGISGWDGKAGGYGDAKYQLGSKPPSGTDYASGLGALLSTFFGKAGMPVTNQFEVYNYNTSSAAPSPNDNNFRGLINILNDNKINILVCFAPPTSSYEGPTATQVEEILAWLEADPNRGLYYTCDWGNSIKVINNVAFNQKFFGVDGTYSASQSNDLIKISESVEPEKFHNEVFQDIMVKGSYTSWTAFPGNPVNLTNPATRFYGATPTYGSIPFDIVDKTEFIPLLYNNVGTASAPILNVILAVDPKRHIVFQGELQFLQGGVAKDGTHYLNPYASSGYLGLKSTTNGDFPKLMANLWEWFMKKVALGK